VSPPLLRVQGVSKHFGGFTALSEVSVAIAPGERFGLIGPNGSGKTTLINCVSGSLRNDAGSIVFEGEDLTGTPAYQRTRKGIARSFQIPRPFHSMSVLENLVVPLEYVVHRGSLHTADTRSEAMEILRDRFGLGSRDSGRPFERPPIDAVLVDPPRAGLHPGVVSRLIQLGTPRLVYVSCNPSTLARDLALLCESRYRIHWVQPIDMFPHTPHIECVASLERVDG